MQMKRFMSYVALALCACFGSSFASAMDRPVSYIVSSLVDIGEMHASALVRMDLTLADWRTGSESTTDSLTSNMRAESNHFVLTSVTPTGVPDWDATAQA